jgi:hypothetical protein
MLSKRLNTEVVLYVPVVIITVYRSEVLKVAFKLVMSSINPEEVAKMDELINQRRKEGWDLVTYTFMGGGGGSDFGRGILMTFKKE